jgi:integrase
MPVHKRKRRGKVTWYCKFDAPGSTREKRKIVREFGFATKQEATDAEAARRMEEQQKCELAKAGSSVAAAPPKTLSALLTEFFSQHVEKKLAPKTIERYKEQSAYLDPALLAMPLAEITPLHLSREWNRLLESGGHHRRTKTTRPLSAKTVRNIAGVISSAFRRAEIWGLVTTNPVARSEPPVPRKRVMKILTVAQQEMLFESATSIWCLPMFLRVLAATASRRGEILALRWCDVEEDGHVMIARSLTQTNEGVAFKTTKTDNPRRIMLPDSVVVELRDHRARQSAFRRQFGPDYRADLDLVFANPDGTPLKPDSVSASVSLLFRKLKLPKGTSMHSLRHTHASELLDIGVSLPVVSARLGHSSVRVTADIYSHAIHGQDDEAARRWEDYHQRNRPCQPTKGVQ